MKVSLRKANALQAAISESLAALDLGTEVTINEFEKPTAKVNEAKARFDKNLGLRAGLLAANYDIRRSVSVANATSGINMILGDVALIEKDIALFGRLAKLDPALDNDVMVGKLGKIKGRSENDFYGREDSVRTGIFTEAEIAGFKSKLAALKKAKVSNQDSLLELNVRTEIELSDETVATLKEVGIV